jgi:hypothetical protein
LAGKGVYNFTQSPPFAKGGWGIYPLDNRYYLAWLGLAWLGLACKDNAIRFSLKIYMKYSKISQK